jgi:pyridoxine/pyridoxamine 5'-phosphate oxidase
MSPLKILVRWIAEERAQGVTFPNGAVLGTVSAAGQPRTRMLGTHLDEDGKPRFHTTPAARKVLDLQDNARASLTYAFQRSLRSVSIDGQVVPLTRDELSIDWSSLDSNFRRSYLIFGSTSGQPLDATSDMNIARQGLVENAEQSMPEYFIGFRFESIDRIAFYSVGDSDFAEHVTYSYNSESKIWTGQNVVP